MTCDEGGSAGAASVMLTQDEVGREDVQPRQLPIPTHPLPVQMSTEQGQDYCKRKYDKLQTAMQGLNEVGAFIEVPL